MYIIFYFFSSLSKYVVIYSALIISCNLETLNVTFQFKKEHLEYISDEQIMSICIYYGKNCLSIKPT